MFAVRYDVVVLHGQAQWRLLVDHQPAAALPQAGLVILASRRFHEPASAIPTTRRYMKAVATLQLGLQCS
jgi:hypothetical protein